jgi:hypothetical protein
MFIDRHPPACMTGKMPIPLAIMSCAAPTRIECPEIRRTKEFSNPAASASSFMIRVIVYG